MKLYHGSNIAGIKVLEPRQADHDRPYIYMSTIEVVAAFYLCNAVEKPYYWFPYGFEPNGNIPIYHELYPNALREVSENVQGYIYEVDADKEQIIPFKNIPCAKLATVPLNVKNVTTIDDAYQLFKSYEHQGKLKIGYYENKTEKQLDWWYKNVAGYLKEKGMIHKQDSSYAKFVKEKLPQAWEFYMQML